MINENSVLCDFKIFCKENKFRKFLNYIKSSQHPRGGAPNTALILKNCYADRSLNIINVFFRNKLALQWSYLSFGLVIFFPLGCSDTAQISRYCAFGRNISTRAMLAVLS